MTWNNTQDEMLEKLVNSDPDRIDQWIDNTVTDLTTAKEVLKLMAGFIALLAIRSGIANDFIKK